MGAATILDLYRTEVERGRDDHLVHLTLSGRRTLSASEGFAATAALAEALAAHGVGKGDRVAQLSDNRPEWHWVDLAALDLGAVHVPIYPTLTAEQVAYQLADSGARVAFAENPDQAAKIASVRERLPDLTLLVQVEGDPVEGAVALEELVAAHRGRAAEEAFWRRAGEVAPDDLASIVYTSGTTGDPKGAMLSHRNFVANVEAVLPRVPLGPEDVALEFLPLCHVFERTCGYAYMAVGCRKIYCSPHVVATVIAEAAPTCFASVPRLYERIHATIMARVAAAPAGKRRLFHWAVETGRRVARHRLEGTPVPLGLRLRHRLADRLVLAKLRAALGGRIRFVLSGGAPLDPALAEFFHAIGIPVQEGYGLTETSPAIGINGYQPGQNRLGSIGKPLDNLEVKLAPDGELLVRGPSVFLGYWNKPEATAEAFDEDGFFRTGDIARIDDDGFIWITDRKKDLIIPAGGKNVAPQPIEGELKKSPYIDNAVLIGDRRPYIVALLSPSEEGLLAWAARHGLGGLSLEELLAEPAVRRLFEEAVAEVNSRLGRFEQIRKFRVLPRPLSQEDGHLTPTLKVKRRVVEREFADLIEAMYAEG